MRATAKFLAVLQLSPVVDRWAAFPQEDSWLASGVKAWSWVVPCKAPTHVLGQKISLRMLITEDKRIHVYTQTHIHLTHVYSDPSLWVCGASSQTLCL